MPTPTNGSSSPLSHTSLSISVSQSLFCERFIRATRSPDHAFNACPVQRIQRLSLIPFPSANHYCPQAAANFTHRWNFLTLPVDRGWGSSVGRERDSWRGGRRFDSHCGRPLPNGWVGVSILWPAETEVMVSRSVSCMAARKIVRPVQDIA